MENLTWLDLRQNQLTGEWTIIGAMVCDAVNTCFVGWTVSTTDETCFSDNCHNAGSVPKEIGNISALQHLWLQENQLSGELR